MSGFEIAGIVLAVLPLFGEVGKAYAVDVTALQKAVSRATRDEKLEEFYREFWWETFELGKLLERVVHGLPGLSEARKQELLTANEAASWKADDVSLALVNFFASQDDRLAFQKIMEKILNLLSQLVKDDMLPVSRDDKNHAKMYTLLEEFEEARREGKTLSSFLERFRFLRKEKTRSVLLANLRTWRRRQGTIVGRATRKTDDTKKAVSARPKIPSPKLRTLSQRLFTALWKCWSCDCANQHEARFCLASCGNAEKGLADDGIHFDFLIAYPHEQTAWQWREATVTITGSVSSTNDQVRAELHKFCDSVHSVHGGKYCAQLLIEDLESSQKIWRLNIREPQLSYLESKPAVTFEAMLKGYAAPSLIEKRRLGLIFAYSLFQLYESPWLSEHWNRDCIHFFYQSASVVDLRRPYLSASFDKFPSSGELEDLNRFHRNLGILRLGVLLIELHKWKPLESFWEEDDLKDGLPTPNTDMLVAKKLLSSLDDCFPTYKGAIESCLMVPWVSGNSRVSLDNPEIWNGVCISVIEPLKREVALGSEDFV